MASLPNMVYSEVSLDLALFATSSKIAMANETNAYEMYKQYIADTEAGGRAYQVEAGNVDQIPDSHHMAAANAAFTAEEVELAISTFKTLDANAHHGLTLPDLSEYFASLSADCGAEPMSPAQKIKAGRGLCVTAGTIDQWFTFLLEQKGHHGEDFSKMLRNASKRVNDAVQSKLSERASAPRGAAARAARTRKPKAERVDEYALLAEEMRNEEVEQAKSARAGGVAKGSVTL